MNLVKFSLFVTAMIVQGAVIVLIAKPAYSNSATYSDHQIITPIGEQEVPKQPSGLGILLVPNCDPIRFQENSDMVPYGAGGSGMGLSCNPSDLSGPSQNPAHTTTKAEEDTSQPPPTNSGYFYGGSSLSSPERPNGAGVYPQLYPPNTSQGTIEYSSGSGKDHGQGAQSSIAAIDPKSAPIPGPEPGEYLAGSLPKGWGGAPNEPTQEAGQVGGQGLNQLNGNSPGK